MKRLLWLTVFLASVMAVGAVAMHAQCTITTTPPPEALGGGTATLNITGCGASPTCSVTGLGSCSCTSGACTYTAPTTTRAQGQSRGIQELPNNNGLNVPVNSLSQISGHLWLQRLQSYVGAGGYLRLYPSQVSFFDNLFSNSQPTQVIDCFYPSDCGALDGNAFPFPTVPNWISENGTFIDALSGYDVHTLGISPNGIESETYAHYIDFKSSSCTAGNPTSCTFTTSVIWTPPQQFQVTIDDCASGSWTGLNGKTYRATFTAFTSGTGGTLTLPVNTSGYGSSTGCKLFSLSDGYECNECNVQSAAEFYNYSNAMLYSTTASGLPISAGSIKPDEVERAVRNGWTDIGHGFVTTIDSNVLGAWYIWPATTNAFGVPNEQAVINTCTNANPTVCTAAVNIGAGSPCWNGSSWGFTTGCTFYGYFWGMTGGWSSLQYSGYNASKQTFTAIDNSHFSVNVNTTSFGPFPSNQVYEVPDVPPFGSWVRLNPSFDLSCVCTTQAWCPDALVILNTLKDFGMGFGDLTAPSDDFDSYVGSNEHMTDNFIDATDNIRANGNGGGCLRDLAQNLQFVDRSGQQLSSNPNNWGATATNEVTVTVNGTASQDVILQGTAAGCARERMGVASGGTYQTSCSVTGNTNTALNYSIEAGGLAGVTVSSSGLVTVPTCPTSVPAQRATVLVVAQADSTASTEVEIDCIPVSTDGAYRLALGNYSEGYVDSTGFQWYGSFAVRAFNDYHEAPGRWFGNQNGTWPGFSACSGDPWPASPPSDAQLNNRSTDMVGDQIQEIAGLAPGGYTLTAYFEPGFGGFAGGSLCGNVAGANLWNWEVQGAQVLQFQDSYVNAGNNAYKGFTETAPATVASNGILNTVLRIRGGISTYGASISSLKITPGNLPPQITTTSPLPQGELTVAYSTTLNAQYGTSPYTWSISAGALPGGLSLTGGCTTLSCTITGTPSASGTFSFTAKICDTNSLCGSANLQLTIQPLPQITTTALPNGSEGMFYSTALAVSGGVAPYTWTRNSGVLAARD